MASNLKKITEYELKQVLDSQKSYPYIFRTRLERALMRASILADEKGLTKLKKESEEIKEKLNYISDHSNQTSDGTLNSYLYLHSDLQTIYETVCSIS